MATVPATGRADPAQPLRLVPDAAGATEELYERYGAQIYRFCLRELGSHEEAEDAAQTTFLNAFRGLDRGVAPEFESAWLHTIAHRVCMSRRRSSFRRGRVESHHDLDVIQELVPSQPSEADELFGLKDALAALPEQQRRALLLREWQGLSCKEIAGELGLSSSAVEMLLFRARRGVVEELTADTPPRRRGLRGRLRTSGDLGSVIAAIKTLFFTGGTKIVATLATVAASSVVAATPVTRHAIADLMMQPPRHGAPRAKVAHIKSPVRGRTHSTSVAPATEPVLPPRAETDAKATTKAKTSAKAKALHLRRRLRTHTPPASTRGSRVAPTRATPQPSRPAPSAVAPPGQPSVAPSGAGAVSPPADGVNASSAGTPADTSLAPAPATAPADQPTAVQPAAPLAPPGQKHRVVTPAPGPAAAPVPAPAVASSAPVAGAAGTTVRITGSHRAAAKAAAFNGVSASFHVDNDSELRAAVPDGAPGGGVTVSTPAGTASGTAGVTVATRPPATPPVARTVSISGFSPTSGAVGTAVTISGAQFRGARSVTFNGTSASFTVASDSQITALLPAGARTGLVTVATKKAAATSAGEFTVAAAAPAVASFSPVGAAVGAWVTISGSGFSGATAVSFNGAPATFTVDSDSQIGARVPVGATTGLVSVTSTGGTATSSGTFAVAVPAAPAASLSPSSAVAGATVTVAGSHFTGATAVSFNGRPASFTILSDSQLEAVVPATATSGTFLVTTPSGTVSSGTFTVAAAQPPPDSLSRAAGPARPSRSAARTSPTRRR